MRDEEHFQPASLLSGTNEAGRSGRRRGPQNRFARPRVHKDGHDILAGRVQNRSAIVNQPAMRLEVGGQALPIDAEMQL
jgi:hypothetical protein